MWGGGFGQQLGRAQHRRLQRAPQGGHGEFIGVKGERQADKGLRSDEGQKTKGEARRIMFNRLLKKSVRCSK